MMFLQVEIRWKRKERANVLLTESSKTDQCAVGMQFDSIVLYNSVSDSIHGYNIIYNIIYYQYGNILIKNNIY